MKWFIAFLLLLVLLVGYWVWPFFALRGLAANLQARNATAVSEEVDYVRVRRFFAEQIIASYFRITGRANKFGSLETAIGASIVDPWLSQIVNPENLSELLRGGTVASELGPVSFRFGNLPASLNTAWSAWLSSEYGLGRFSIGLPPDAPGSNQFRLRMQLLDWRWKITGIGLPERLSNQIAHELAKKYP
jgi:hypothetical protein